MGEPVLGHKDFWNVSLVVNNLYCCCSLIEHGDQEIKSMGQSSVQSHEENLKSAKALCKLIKKVKKTTENRAERSQD